MVKHLLRDGHGVVVADNLSTGHRDAVLGGELVELDIDDAMALDAVFAGHRFDAVMHFASFIDVSESVREPAKYYANNLSGTLSLLQAMLRAGVPSFIFSSSAAVYGNPEYVPVDEAHPKAPINPYGSSKWMVEQILEDLSRAHGLESVRLRYFNAAGADPEGQLGERHEPETHLIPLVLQTASRHREALTVFGRDYATPDGTCIRDFVHVSDLVAAHALALDYLLAGGKSRAFNLGSGQGFSVQTVINIARQVTGRDIPLLEAERRLGDPPQLVADASLAKHVLGWKPRYADLETIIEHAWRWEQDFPR
jgi:UDP-glucose 4-epimerase